MPRPATLAALAALILLPACSGVSVSTRAEGGIDLARFQTFVQAAPPETASATLPGYTPALGDAINAAIAAQLEAHGYRLADASDADLVVAFVVEGEEQLGVQLAPVYAGELYGWEHERSKHVYVASSLVIDVFDARSQQLLWHGVGEMDLFESEAGEGAAHAAVRAVLARFPARSQVSASRD
jgi:hypothetical protein